MAAGDRRRGYPRSDEERLARHRRIYGSDVLPPRGTGLGRLSADDKSTLMVAGVVIGLIGLGMAVYASS